MNPQIFPFHSGFGMFQCHPPCKAHQPGVATNMPASIENVSVSPQKVLGIKDAVHCGAGLRKLYSTYEYLQFYTTVIVKVMRNYTVYNNIYYIPWCSTHHITHMWYSFWSMLIYVDPPSPLLPERWQEQPEAPHVFPLPVGAMPTRSRPQDGKCTVHHPLASSTSRK